MTAREQKCVTLPHLLQHTATPRTPDAFYLGSLRGIADKKPKWPLFPRSSNLQRKGSNYSLQSCGSPRAAAWAEGGSASAVPAPTHTVQGKTRSWHLHLLAMALPWVPEKPSAQPSAQPCCLLRISVFDLHLWSPSKKVSNCRGGNNFDILNTSRRGSMEYFQVDTIRTKLT